MKKNKLIIVSLLAVACFISCEKNSFFVTDRIAVADKALLKLGYFAAGVLNQPAQLKINGIRISDTLPYNTPFPGGGLNTRGSNNSDYLMLEPGANSLLLSVPHKGKETDSIVLLEQSIDLPASRQTLFVTDSFPHITTVLVNDEATAPTDSGKARIKFVHLIPDVAAVDFYRNNELIKANVPYKSVTEYVDVYAGSVTYRIREAGSTTDLATRPINAVAGRIYTFFSRGFKGMSGTLGPNVSAMTLQ